MNTPEENNPQDNSALDERTVVEVCEDPDVATVTYEVRVDPDSSHVDVVITGVYIGVPLEDMQAHSRRAFAKHYEIKHDTETNEPAQDELNDPDLPSAKTQFGVEVRRA